MPIKKIMLGSLIGMAVASVLIWFLWNKSSASSELAVLNDKEPDFFSTFFSKSGELLPQADVQVNCNKSIIPEDESLLWKDSDRADTYIYFDSKTRILSVCDRGLLAAGKILQEVGGRPEEVEAIRVDEAQFQDMDGDGKKEFLLYHGYCIKENCSGRYMLLRAQEDGRLRILYLLAGEASRYVHDNGGRILVIEKKCQGFDQDLGPAYFGVAEFQVNGDLAMVPFRDVRTRFPFLLKDESNSTNSDFDMKDIPLDDQHKAFLQLSKLIDRAYREGSSPEIRASYESTLEALPAVEGEVSKEDRWRLHCNPREILEAIMNR